MNSAYRLSIAALLALLSTQGLRTSAAQQALAAESLNAAIAPPQTLLTQADTEYETLEVDDLDTAGYDFVGTGDRTLLIQANESIGYVTLKDTSSATLTGEGEIAHARFRDASTVNMTDSSHISHANLEEEASITMSGTADVSHLTLSGSSTAEISENAEISHLNLQENAEGTIAGGTFSFINLSDQSVAHIRQLTTDGGAFIASGVNTSGGAVTYTAGTTLHIYGQALSFADGTISGNWADGTPFALTLILNVGNQEEDGFFEIPTVLPSEVVFHEV